MKKLKEKQRGPWCSFCPPKTTRAVYRQDCFSGKFSCERHSEDLLIIEQKEDDKMTEADYQTWGRV